jgi:hypothetical protein
MNRQSNEEIENSCTQPPKSPKSTGRWWSSSDAMLQHVFSTPTSTSILISVAWQQGQVGCISPGQANGHIAPRRRCTGDPSSRAWWSAGQRDLAMASPAGCERARVDVDVQVPVATGRRLVAAVTASTASARTYCTYQGTRGASNWEPRDRDGDDRFSRPAGRTCGRAGTATRPDQS